MNGWSRNLQSCLHFCMCFAILTSQICSCDNAMLCLHPPISNGPSPSAAAEGGTLCPLSSCGIMRNSWFCALWVNAVSGHHSLSTTVGTRTPIPLQKTSEIDVPQGTSKYLIKPMKNQHFRVWMSLEHGRYSDVSTERLPDSGHMLLPRWRTHATQEACSGSLCLNRMLSLGHRK